VEKKVKNFPKFEEIQREQSAPIAICGRGMSSGGIERTGPSVWRPRNINWKSGKEQVDLLNIMSEQFIAGLGDIEREVKN